MSTNKYTKSVLSQNECIHCKRKLRLLKNTDVNGCTEACRCADCCILDNDNYISCASCNEWVCIDCHHLGHGSAYKGIWQMNGEPLFFCRHEKCLNISALQCPVSFK